MVRIAFVSCAHVGRRPLQPAWDAIAAAQPDLLLLLGDTTYMSWDGQDWLIDDLARSYADQFQVPGFRQLLQRVPHLAIWDDHDAGPNDCCGAEFTAQQMAQSRALFDTHLVTALNNNRPHMYCSHDIGPVRVIMLDVRTHRTHSNRPLATVLGPVQEAWLWQQLADNPLPYTVLCSGSVIDRGAAGHKFKDYPAFHQRLMAELQHRPGAARSRKLLFLSGDIHDNRWRRWPGFYEATSSGVACISPANQGSQPTDNWGLAEFEEASDSLTVHLNGHPPSYTGTHRVRLSNWQPMD